VRVIVQARTVAKSVSLIQPNATLQRYHMKIEIQTYHHHHRNFFAFHSYNDIFITECI
jgi:hypothetical protein